MKKYENVESTQEQPQFWTDDYHVYVLISQEKVASQIGTKPNDPIVAMFRFSYMEYTKEEWNELVTQDSRNQIISQIDQTLDTVKYNKILESKALLERYLQEHPLFSTVHKEEGEYYAVTSEKQNYLLYMISLCVQSEDLGVEFIPTWNATGQSCEPWTRTELQQLALQIASFVYPAVSKQQYYEKIINASESVGEIQNLDIDYTKDVVSGD